MDYFFYVALISFFLFAPFVHSDGITPRFSKWLPSPPLIGIVILLVIVLLGVFVFPDYFKSGTIIGPTEAVRILLGIYFGCIWRFLWDYFAKNPNELIYGLSVSDHAESAPRWRVWAFRIGSWPALGLISLFFIALAVPHLDKSLVRLNWLKVGELEVGFEGANAEAFAASEDLVFKEDRIEYSEHVMNLAFNLPTILDQDRKMYGLIEYSITKPKSRFWLKEHYDNNNSDAMFHVSKAFLQEVLVPYARCANETFANVKANRASVGIAVQPVSLLLQKFLSTNPVDTHVVVRAINASIQTLRQLAVSETEPCSIYLDNHPIKRWGGVEFRENVKASYYIYLYTSYILVFQQNLAGATFFLEEHKKKFQVESNYGYAQAEASYLTPEEPNKTVKLMKSTVDDALHLLETIKKEYRRRIKEEGTISQEWVATYKEQQNRIQQRVLRVKNETAYEVIRSLAAGYTLNDKWKSIGALYIRDLEKFLNSSDPESKAETKLRMNFLDTVGFGIFVYALHNDRLDGHRARKAIGYLREAKDLAHGIEEINDFRRIRNHLRFATRIIERAGRS